MILHRDQFLFVEKPDQLEMVENRRFTKTMKLFKLILDDFSHHDFTLQDIKTAYTIIDKNNKTKARYGLPELKNLVDRGLLIFENLEYSIDYFCPEIALIDRYEWDE